MKTNREIDKKADLKEQLKDNDQKSRIFMAVDLTTQNRLVVRQISERNYLIEYKGSDYVVNVKGISSVGFWTSVEEIYHLPAPMQSYK